MSSDTRITTQMARGAKSVPDAPHPIIDTTTPIPTPATLIGVPSRLGQRSHATDNEAERRYYEATGRWPMTDDRADFIEACRAVGAADPRRPTHDEVARALSYQDEQRHRA